MSVAMRKHHIDRGMVTMHLRVRRSNVSKIKNYAQILESGEEGTYTIPEVFPEYIGKEQQVALRAYRYREDLTQRQLSELTGISQHYISKMENGKRIIGKEQAKVIARILNADYQMFI